MREPGSETDERVAPTGAEAPPGPFVERQLRQRENRTAAAEAARMMWRSDARFRALVQHAPDGVVLLDADGRISYASPPSGHLLGVHTEDLLGRRPAELVCDPRPVGELLALEATAGEPAPTTARTVRVARGDDTLAWHEWQAVDMRQEPNVRAVALTLRDVTDLVDADERARTIQRVSLQMGEQVETALILDCLAGETGRALDADAVDVRIAHPDEPSGRSAAHWSSDAGARPDELDELADELGRLFAAEGGAIAVNDVASDGRLSPAVRRALSDGGVHVLLATPLTEDRRLIGALILRRTAPRPWRTSDMALVAGLAHEATIHLRYARARAHEERSLERMRQLDRAKSEFVSSVSHELRTPLASIIGYLEMVLDGDAGPLRPEQRRMLTAIERNSRSLNRLIEDLLLVSRIEARSFSSERQPTSLRAVVESVMGVLAPNLSERGHGLELDVERGLPLVLGNADHLEQMLLNLVGNAIKFTPDGGDIAVGVHRDGAEVVIEVADSGIGIPADELPQLFTRFFRSTPARERAIPGTGLGLAIVSEIVDQHRGRVAVDSTVDVGTTVTVRLPLAAPPETRPHMHPSPAPPHKENEL